MQASTEISKAFPTTTQTVEVKPHTPHSEDNASLFSDLLDTHDPDNSVAVDQLSDTSNLQDPLFISHPPLESVLIAPPAGSVLQHVGLITAKASPGSLLSQDVSGVEAEPIEATTTENQTSLANAPATRLTLPAYYEVASAARPASSQDQAIMVSGTQNANHTGQTPQGIPAPHLTANNGLQTANHNTILQDLAPQQLTSAPLPESLVDPRIKPAAATGKIIPAIAPESLNQNSDADSLLSGGVNPAPANTAPSEIPAISQPLAQLDTTDLTTGLDAIDLSQTSTPQSDSSSGLGLAQSTIITPAAPISLPLAPAAANPIVASPKEIPTIISESLPTADPDNSRIMVQLDPPELGRVTIDFRFEGQVLQAVTITGESPEALRQLRHMHFELIQALEQNGLSNSDLEFRQEQSAQRQFNNSPSDPQAADESLDMPNLSDRPVTDSISTPKSNQTQTALDIRV